MVIIVKSIILVILILMTITLVAVMMSFFNLINNLEKNMIDDNQDSDVSYHDKIRNNYIRSLNSLFGGSPSSSYIFFVNQNDPNDIKLPYQFLSIQQSLNVNKLFALDIPFNYTQLMFRSNEDIHNVTLHIPSRQWVDVTKYESFDIYYKTGNKVIVVNNQFKLDYNDTNSNEENLINNLKTFIDDNQLNPESLIDYYTALIKQKQPSFDEKYDILTRFEKAKDQVIKLNTLNNQAKVDKLLEDYNQKGYSNDTYDQINNELLNLVNHKDESKL